MTRLGRSPVRVGTRQGDDRGQPTLHLTGEFTDRFVERVKRFELKGTDFVPLWSSDGVLPTDKPKARGRRHRLVRT